MNDPKELIVKIDASQIQNLVADVEAKIYPAIAKLRAENTELKAELAKFKECFEHPKETCRGFTIAECSHIYHKEG